MRSLTFLVPALNEEKYIATTVEEILPVARRELDTFEMILVDDGSTDRTGEIMDSLASENPEIQVIHNPECLGLGWSFQKGIEIARFDYMTVIPGDNAYNVDGLDRVIHAMDAADMVISYRQNQAKTRTLFRQLLSRSYRFFIALIFGFKPKDFHSVVVYPVSGVRALDLQLLGYAYQLEVLVKLLRRGYSFAEVPVSLNSYNQHNSRALRLEVLAQISKMIWHLWQDGTRVKRDSKNGRLESLAAYPKRGQIDLIDQAGRAPIAEKKPVAVHG